VLRARYHNKKNNNNYGSEGLQFIKVNNCVLFRIRQFSPEDQVADFPLDEVKLCEQVVRQRHMMK